VLNSISDDGVLVLAREILRYLHTHPEAKDSLEGIRHWWLPRGHDDSRVALERAIEYLVVHQYVTEHEMRAGARIYSLRRDYFEEEAMSSYEAIAEQLAEDRRELESILLKRSSVYPVLVDQMKRVYGEDRKDGGLSQTHKILIAVAMAVQSGSKSALEWTITRAVNHGATDEMIRDAVDVALLNGGTFAVSNARFAVAALDVRRRRPRKS
jgi:alkylhydroperoxidase/carboxymuconolactone decarboxylase family protein YurZ